MAKAKRKWDTFEVGDVVAIKWQDPTKHDNHLITGISEVTIVHTTTIGQLVFIDKHSVMICSERVWNDYSDDNLVHAFPHRVIEDIIVLCRKDAYMRKLGKLVTIAAEEKVSL